MIEIQFLILNGKLILKISIFHRVVKKISKLVIQVKKVVNHFEYHQEISNKMFLFLNMMSYCEVNNDLFSQKNNKFFNIYPSRL